MAANQPDDRQCKTLYLSDQLWECLVDNPVACPFNIALGAEYFCLHQKSEEFGSAEKMKWTSAAA